MKNFFAFIIVFFILIILAVGLLVGVRAIPNNLIKENVHSSSEYLVEYGDSVKLFGNPFWKLDNFTDSWMLNITYYTDSTTNFQQVLLNPYMDSEELTKKEILKEIVENPAAPHGVKSHYSRYWHGYQITLKPLLLFTDYQGIRIINICVFSLLFVIVIIGCWKKLPKIYAVAFFLSYCIFYLPAGPISLQFSSCFLISLFSLCFLLFVPASYKNRLNICLFFFVVGALTSFFDLLTAPLVTLGFPLIVYGGLTKGMSVKKTLILSIFWAAGYVLFWSAKWCLAYFFTDYNIIADAINEVQYRAIGELADHFNIILRKILIITFSALLLIGLLFYLFHAKKSRRQNPLSKKIGRNIYLLAIAYYPLVWFLLFSNHSIIHIWFTYRSWSVTFFALILFCYNLLYEKDSRNASLSQ